MTSSYSTRKRFEKQNPGENSNTWGGYLNTNTIDLIDEAFGAVCVAMTTAGDSTLNTQNGVTDEGRNSILILTGAPTSNIRLFVPAAESFYFVRNKMTGSNRVRITCNGGVNGVDFSGTGSGAEQGVVISDGTNVHEVARTVSAANTFTKGMIMPFYNSVGAIPSGWGLCDGTNGTPNLNDKFIIGTTSAGNVETSIGFTGLVASASAGEHAHGDYTASVALTSAHIPAHAHYMFSEFSESTDNNSKYLYPNGTAPANARVSPSRSFAGGASNYEIAGHVTTANVSQGQTSWAYSSTADAHAHGITSNGDHYHNVSVGRPPSFYLYYIMKLT